MSVISYYTGQIEHIRRDRAGQAMVLFLTVLSAVLALAFSAVYTAHLGAEKVASSNAVDAIALSAATWEARGLNLIASLNDGILQCLRVIRWICVVWASLALAAVFGGGMPAFLEYSRQAPGMIRSYWKTAKQLEAWAEKVKAITPSLVLAETASLSRKLNVTGVISPLNPKGPHDGENTLELHLKHGTPLGLADAMSPITDIPGRIGGWKWAKKIAGAVNGIIGTAVGSILAGGDGTPIRMLEPEEDFPIRQKVRFAGYRAVSPLPLPFLGRSVMPRFALEAIAEPYGGNTANMTWKSRLTENTHK